MNDDIQKMQAFDTKQMLTGKIFDFKVDSNNKVWITKYHENPQRKEIIIPDFVQGLSYNKSELYGSIFEECKYIKKIKSKRALEMPEGLFSKVNIGELDLSELSTENTASMREWFKNAAIYKLKFGGIFTTKNVRSLEGMFECSRIPKIIDADKSFDTAKCKHFDSMFSMFNTLSINLGDKFVLSNDANVRGMFEFSEITDLNFGESFKLYNDQLTKNIFKGCTISNMIIYNSILANKDNEFEDAVICCIKVKGKNLKDSEIEELREALPKTLVVKA